jgi:hypothetical protein
VIPALGRLGGGGGGVVITLRPTWATYQDSCLKIPKKKEEETQRFLPLCTQKRGHVRTQKVSAHSQEEASLGTTPYGALISDFSLQSCDKRSVCGGGRHLFRFDGSLSRWMYRMNHQCLTGKTSLPLFLGCSPLRESLLW